METTFKSIEEKAADNAVNYMIFSGGILMGEYDAHLQNIMQDCRDRAKMIYESFN